jgi:dTDP-D-glucose 4,6-dehydratase
LTGSTGELVFGAVPDRHDEPLRIADVEETYRRIGWRAAVTLEEGIRRTVAWYLDSERKAE